MTEAQPRSTETLGEAILNLKGQIDSLLPEGPVIICFIIPFYYSKEINDYFNWKLISSTMGLVTKKHIRLNDHKLFLRVIIMKNNINSNQTHSFVQTSVNSESVLTALICTLKSVILDDIAISFCP